MPTYEYKCENENCEHTLEIIQSIKEEPLEFCPNCGEKTFKRVPSLSSLILKGYGWYKNTTKPSSNDS